MRPARPPQPPQRRPAPAPLPGGPAFQPAAASAPLRPPWKGLPPPSSPTDAPAHARSLQFKASASLPAGPGSWGGREAAGSGSAAGKEGATPRPAAARAEKLQRRASSKAFLASNGGLYVVQFGVEGRGSEVVVKKRGEAGRSGEGARELRNGGLGRGRKVELPPPRSRLATFADGPGDWWASQLLPSTSAQALDQASLKLRYILHQLNRGELPLEELKKNIEYAALVLETAYMDETRRMCEEEDELSEVTPEAVPDEVREWLAATFTSQPTTKRTKPKFKSVANAIRTGIFFEKLFKKVVGSPQIPVPAQFQPTLKELGKWEFDVFALNDASDGHALQWVGTELFNRYGFLARFKMGADVVTAFLLQLEAGYSKHANPYHNLVHAADVAQTTHFFLSQSGFLDCMSDLEALACLFSALIHDYEHTGHTNNFHVQSQSELSLLYNDRSVLENHHASAAFRFMRERPETNVLERLTREEFREFRNLVVEIVLATDMSTHFVQVKTMKSMLTLPEGIDKVKAICLIVHCSDISHPAKRWEVHSRWTSQVLAEFFRQGDLEASLGLPYSPLCDRHSTHVADSQIGFIDFIVDPTLMVCSEMLVKMVEPLVAMSGPSVVEEEESVGSASPAPAPSSARSRSRLPLTPDGRLNIPTPGIPLLKANRSKWKEKAVLEEAERKKAAAAEAEKAGPKDPAK